MYRSLSMNESKLNLILKRVRRVVQGSTFNVRNSHSDRYVFVLIFDVWNNSTFNLKERLKREPFDIGKHIRDMIYTKLSKLVDLFLLIVPTSKHINDFFTTIDHYSFFNINYQLHYECVWIFVYIIGWYIKSGRF